MSNASDDDNEWEKRHLEYEAHIDELSKSLRVCAIHGNPASINSGYESELSILADPCGCWLQAEYYDSIDECVEAWNKQPRIDAMQATIAALRERIATLEAELVDAYEPYILKVIQEMSDDWLRRFPPSSDQCRDALLVRAWFPVDMTDYEELNRRKGSEDKGSDE